jgi:hypothetical protein
MNREYASQPDHDRCTIGVPCEGHATADPQCKKPPWIEFECKGIGNVCRDAEQKRMRYLRTWQSDHRESEHWTFEKRTSILSRDHYVRVSKSPCWNAIVQRTVSFAFIQLSSVFDYD